MGTGSVTWENDRVMLTSSTVAECKEVIHQLKTQKHTAWSIELIRLSPQSLLTLLNDINECQVWRLEIWNTHFDSICVSELSQVVTYTKKWRSYALTPHLSYQILITY